MFLREINQCHGNQLSVTLNWFRSDSEGLREIESGEENIVDCAHAVSYSIRQLSFIKFHVDAKPMLTLYDDCICVNAGIINTSVIFLNSAIM